VLNANVDIKQDNQTLALWIYDINKLIYPNWYIVIYLRKIIQRLRNQGLGIFRVWCSEIDFGHF
jgi:hypothetical protein